MMKTGIKLLGILMVVLAAAVFVGCERKHDDPAAHQAAEAVAGDGEQTLCPVMDAPINKNLFVEYQGKKVYFCCPGCETEFLKNPEKYLDKLPQFQK